MTAKCYNCLDINFKSTSTHLDLINKNDGIIVDSGQKIHTKQYLNETIIFIQQNSSSKIITIQHKIFKSQFVVLFLVFSDLRAEKNKSELNQKGHEPSRAENTSVRAMARASSARTHH